MDEVADWHDLNSLRDDLDGDYVLINDLDADTDGYEEHVSNPDGGWEPILLFEGIFDGSGYQISDLVIDRPDDTAVGLFGSTNSGKIKNIRLEDFEVAGRDFVGGLVGGNGGEILNSSVHGNLTGDTLVGVLVGENDGTVNESWSSGEVTGSDDTGGLVGENKDDAIVKNSYSTTTVGDGVRLGGLIGRNSGTVENSLATGNVTGSSFSVGGLIGINSSDVNTCYATGDVTGSGSRVGGLVGVNSADVVESYAEGDVNGEEGVGGLVGELYGNVQNSYAQGNVEGDLNVGGLVGGFEFGTLTEGYATGEVFGAIRVGGLVGKTEDGDIIEGYWDIEAANRDDGIGSGDGDVTGLSTDEMQGMTAEENMDGLDFEDKWAVQTEPDNYPALQWQLNNVTFTVSIPAIEPDDETTINVTAPDTDNVVIDKLWTDWQITAEQLDGGDINIEPPATPDKGTVEVSWDSQQDIDVTLGINPNYDNTPEIKYIGGEYLLEIRCNGGNEETTATLEILEE